MRSTYSVKKAQIDWLAINVNGLSFLPAAAPVCLEHEASSLQRTTTARLGTQIDTCRQLAARSCRVTRRRYLIQV